jgi:hypothetical protein
MPKLQIGNASPVEVLRDDSPLDSVDLDKLNARAKDPNDDLRSVEQFSMGDDQFVRTVSRRSLKDTAGVTEVHIPDSELDPPEGWLADLPEEVRRDRRRQIVLASLTTVFYQYHSDSHPTFIRSEDKKLGEHVAQAFTGATIEIQDYDEPRRPKDEVLADIRRLAQELTPQWQKKLEDIVGPPTPTRQARTPTPSRRSSLPRTRQHARSRRSAPSTRPPPAP